MHFLLLSSSRIFQKKRSRTDEQKEIKPMKRIDNFCEWILFSIICLLFPLCLCTSLLILLVRVRCLFRLILFLLYSTRSTLLLLFFCLFSLVCIDWLSFSSFLFYSLLSLKYSKEIWTKILTIFASWILMLMVCARAKCRFDRYPSWKWHDSPVFQVFRERSVDNHLYDIRNWKGNGTRGWTDPVDGLTKYCISRGIILHLNRPSLQDWHVHLQQ